VTVAILVAVLIASELAWRLPFAKIIRQMRVAVLKSSHVIRSVRVSDHWKEKVLLIYSRQIAAAAATLFVMLCLVASPFLPIGYLGEGGFAKLAETMFAPSVLVEAALVGGIYIWLRRKLA
jgi:hypothetical protein